MTFATLFLSAASSMSQPSASRALFSSDGNAAGTDEAGLPILLRGAIRYIYDEWTC